MDCIWLYWKNTPIFFDDYQKLMNQYEVFERELAQYFTEELQNGKSFFWDGILQIQNKSIKNKVRLPFFSNLQRA